MAVDAEIRDIQGLIVVPMMALETVPASAPGTALRALDQSELFRERRGIARRTRADASRTEEIEADFQVALQTCELGVLSIPTGSFHHELPVLKPSGCHERQRGEPVSAPSAEPPKRASDDSW